MSLNDRIVKALESCDYQRTSYYRLMELVWPFEQYPRAYRSSMNGGPPGVAMAFGKALRLMAGEMIIWRPESYKGQRFGQRDVQLRCKDCDDCKRHAYSDAITPGFFYDTCEKHRRGAR